jgi:hypothetical protein
MGSGRPSDLEFFLLNHTAIEIVLNGLFVRNTSFVEWTLRTIYAAL